MGVSYSETVYDYSEKVYLEFANRLELVFKYKKQSDTYRKTISRDVIIYKLEEVTNEYFEILDDKKIKLSNDYLWLNSINQYMSKYMKNTGIKNSEYSNFIKSTMSQINVLMDKIKKDEIPSDVVNQLSAICRNFLYLFNNKEKKDNKYVEMSLPDCNPNKFLEWVHSEKNMQNKKVQATFNRLKSFLGITGGAGLALATCIFLLPETLLISVPMVALYIGAGGFIGNTILNSIVKESSKNNKNNRIIYNRFIIMFTLFLYYKYKDESIMYEGVY